MHAFAQKQSPAQQTRPACSATRGRESVAQKTAEKTRPPSSTARGRMDFAQIHEGRTIGTPTVQRSLRDKSEKLQSSPDRGARTGFESDISRIPVHADARAKIQTKLTVNTPGDVYEQEADRVADQVMRMPEPNLQRACACGGACPKCQAEERERLQTKRVQAGDTGQTTAPPIVDEVLRSPGQPLSPTSHTFFEPRFGHDFSNVRVHADSRASEAAQAVSAKAFTVGRDIVFATSQYAPDVVEGRRLLAHELTHVVQNDSRRPLASSRTRTPLPILHQAREGRIARQPTRRAVNYLDCVFITVGGGMRMICPPSVERSQRFNRLIGDLSQYQTRISSVAASRGVPEQVLTGVIYVEQLDRSAFGDWWGKLWGKRTVSLGLGQIQVIRAAEIVHQGRDLRANPLTDAEFDALVSTLENPAQNIDLLAQELLDNFQFYGRQPGKTVADRWNFALARHKGGHGPVGTAQVAANNNGQNSNSWSDVATHLSQQIVAFVNEVQSVRLDP